MVSIPILANLLTCSGVKSPNELSLISSFEEPALVCAPFFELFAVVVAAAAGGGAADDDDDGADDVGLASDSPLCSHHRLLRGLSFFELPLFAAAISLGGGNLAKFKSNNDGSFDDCADDAFAALDSVSMPNFANNF